MNPETVVAAEDFLTAYRDEREGILSERAEKLEKLVSAPGYARFGTEIISDPLCPEGIGKNVAGNLFDWLVESGDKWPDHKGPAVEALMNLSLVHPDWVPEGFLSWAIVDASTGEW